MTSTACAEESALAGDHTLPARWTWLRNKVLLREYDERCGQEGGELLTVSHITGISPRAQKADVTMFLAESTEEYKRCKVGDLVINTMWAWMGALGVSQYDGIVSPSYNVYRFHVSDVEPRFFGYLFNSPPYVAEINRFSKGVWTSRLRLYPEAFLGMSTPVPPRPVQRAIVEFLDRKTAAIDTLVAKKERLVELLQEKRQALITQAVTRGLDPSVPMKDSGVEWLPKIPAGWDLPALAHVAVSMCDGPFGSDMKSSHYADTGVRLIRLQNIGAGTFEDDDQAYVPEAHFAALPGHDARPGDLLVAGLGDENHAVGRACILPSDIQVAMVKADCFRVRLDERRLTQRFAAWYLNSSAARNAVALETRGATRSRMNLSGLSRIRVPVPPLAEQGAICEWVEQGERTSQAVAHATSSSVEKLREYRQALITAAVTGKIDVTKEAA